MAAPTLTQRCPRIRFYFQKQLLYILNKCLCNIPCEWRTNQLHWQTSISHCTVGPARIITDVEHLSSRESVLFLPMNNGKDSLQCPMTLFQTEGFPVAGPSVFLCFICLKSQCTFGNLRWFPDRTKFFPHHHALVEFGNQRVLLW